jgi:hypothetical protein
LNCFLHFFKDSNPKSLTKQLSNYGFTRKDEGAYFHPLFHRDSDPGCLDILLRYRAGKSPGGSRTKQNPILTSSISKSTPEAVKVQTIQTAVVAGKKRAVPVAPSMANLSKSDSGGRVTRSIAVKRKNSEAAIAATAKRTQKQKKRPKVSPFVNDRSNSRAAGNQADGTFPTVSTPEHMQMIAAFLASPSHSVRSPEHLRMCTIAPPLDDESIRVLCSATRILEVSPIKVMGNPRMETPCSKYINMHAVSPRHFVPTNVFCAITGTLSPSLDSVAEELGCCLSDL